MSDRRKLPLSRRLLSMLPAKLRFGIMRNRLKISDELDSKFAFRIARSQEELSEAYRILHDSYLELGYSKAHISGMRGKAPCVAHAKPDPDEARVCSPGRRLSPPQCGANL